MKYTRSTMCLKLVLATIICAVPILCSDNQTDSDPNLNVLRQCTECRHRDKKPLLTEPLCVECYCDLECIKYGDCCIDLLIDNNLHTRQIDSGLNCVGPSPIDTIKLRNINADQYGYYMRNFYFKSETIKEFCNAQFLPVSCGNGISYVNMECALINKATDCIHWSIESECTDALNPNCDYYHVPPLSVELRLCDIHRSSDIISTCTMEDDKFTTFLCEKYFSLVYGKDGRVFRNIFCQRCNDENWTSILSEGGNPFLSLTFFADKFNKAVTPCDGETAWMDIYADKCRPIKCYSEKILKDGLCLSNGRTALGNKYQLLIQLDITSPHPVPIIRQIVGDVMYRTSEEMYSTDYVIEESVQIPQNKNSLLFLHIWTEINQDILIDALEIKFSKLNGRVFWQFSDLDVFFKVIRYQLQHSGKTAKYLKSDLETGLCCTVEEKFQLSHKLEYEPVTNELSCSYIEFDQSEVKVRGDALVPHLNLTLSQEKGEFSFIKNKLSVCFELFLLKTNLTRTNGTYYISNEKDSFDVILWYITIVCISLSLFSLVIVIITYLVFKELRTQPGINNLILSCNLFLAQIILMVGFDKTHHVTLCKALGVITHFFWLSMIFWMNICSYHMFKVFVFRKFVVRSSSGVVKQSIFYSIYGYCTPILIIAITIVANVIPTSGDDLGYGGNICYLSSKLLVLFSFVIPLCVVILSNVIFFTWTIVTIHRVKQEGKQTGERNNVYIYLKLSVVTGMFWTISLLSNFFDTVVLDYISVILNGSQGFFLLWSFVLNKSVWNKWKNCGKSVTTDSSSHIKISKITTSEI